jgi:hypothetical protein
VKNYFKRLLVGCRPVRKDRVTSEAGQKQPSEEDRYCGQKEYCRRRKCKEESRSQITGQRR